MPDNFSSTDLKKCKAASTFKSPSSSGKLTSLTSSFSLGVSNLPGDLGQIQNMGLLTDQIQSRTQEWLPWPLWQQWPQWQNSRSGGGEWSTNSTSGSELNPLRKVLFLFIFHTKKMVSVSLSLCILVFLAIQEILAIWDITRDHYTSFCECMPMV